MFEKIISFSIRNKLIVSIGVLGLIAWGLYSLQHLPIDAVPDITNNQVQVVTISPALAPQEVERLITMPVELTMASIPGVMEMRSISRFGLSVVTIVFEDDVDVYWARAQVDQRLIEIQREIPQGAGTPILAPVTTGLGEIYQYTIRAKPGYEHRYSLTQLRTIQDWIVRRRLLGTKGIADVSSFGGYLKQVEIAIDPVRLRSSSISMETIINAVNRNNANSGGAYIERRSDVQYIRTDGIARTVDDVANIVVRSGVDTPPLRIRDIATVREGHAIRYGAMTRGSKNEAVGGIVLMLKGANSSEVIQTVKSRIASIQKSLPEGVVIEPFLDRTKLVNKAITTVSTNLLEGALIVIFVLVLILGNLRAGFIVASVIPLAMLFAVSMMRVFGVSGNLMSLGALDFGLIVDGAVIIVEAVLHALHSQKAGTGHSENTVLHAAVGIRRSAAFGEIIIMIVYFPILALVGIEGKMFKPMAETVIFAVAGAFILSTTYVPMMSALLLKQGLKTWPLADRIMELITRAYLPARRFAMRNMRIAIGGTLVMFGTSIAIFITMGGEFLPQLDEGDFAIEMRLMTGQNLSASISSAQQAAAILTSGFPEVEHVIGKIGTSEIPLDPMPMESGDLIVVLRDKKEWTSAKNREELAEKMQDALAAIPGVTFSFQQPIQMRFNELMTGARQDVVVKIFGEDMDSLASIAHRIGSIATTVKGAEDVYVEPVSGLPQVTIAIKRDACALHGVDVEDVNTTVRAAFAGVAAGQVYEDERRFDVVVRMDSLHRHNPQDVASLMVPTRDGRQVPILQVASIDVILGPNQIQHEDAHRRIAVGFNVRGRDVESIVQELESRITSTLSMPSGYYVTFGGQFENLAAAKQRLGIAVPVALLLILFLLYITFTNINNALLIFSAVPLSAIGGILALWTRGMPFSISAGVGFIALFGVAVLNGIVLLGAFRKLAQQDSNVLRVVLRGTEQRLRPVAMTALVASLGFLPMAISHGDGAEVQRPLATVVIGGLVTSTLLTLIIVPLLYTIIERRKQHRRKRTAARAAGLILLASLSASLAYAQPPAITLDQATALALQHNAHVQVAALESEQLFLQKRAAWEIPPLNATYMGGQYNSLSTDNNITLTQSIPFPTKLSNASSLANEVHKESVIRSSATQLQVLHDVKRAYVDICSLKERIRMLDAYEQLAQRALTVARRREAAGEGTKLERVSAETHQSDVSLQRLTTRAELQQAELRLSTLCGSESAVTTIDTLIPMSWVRHVDSNDLSSNPMIRLLEQRIHTAEQQHDLSTSQYFPDLSVGYFTQTLIGTPLSNPMLTASASNRFTGFTIGLSVPLWAFSTSAKVEQSKIQQDIVHKELAYARATIALDLQQTRSSIELARQSVAFYATRALRESSLLAEQSQRSFEAGEISWLEFQLALQRHINVQTMEIDSRHRLVSLLFHYELLTGSSR